jgi:hypothetical protein
VGGLAAERSTAAEDDEHSTPADLADTMPVKSMLVALPQGPAHVLKVGICHPRGKYADGFAPGPSERAEGIAGANEESMLMALPQGPTHVLKALMAQTKDEEISDLQLPLLPKLACSGHWSTLALSTQLLQSW